MVRFHNSVAVLLLTAISAFNLTRAHAQSHYTVTDLGAFPGDIAFGFPNTSTPTAINNNGQVTGQAVKSSRTRAFGFENGQFFDLGSLPNQPAGYSELEQASGTGINNNGVICGVANDYTTGQNVFVYTPQTGMVSLASGNIFGAAAINDQAQVIGTASLSSTPHAFIFSAGTKIDLGVFPGAYSSSGADINNSGHAVGTSGFVGYARAFFFSDGHMTDLSVLPGFVNSYAIALNDRDQIIGICSGVPEKPEAFLYQNSEMTDLGTFDISDVNLHGEIVGSTAFNPLLYQSGTLIPLNSLLDDNQKRLYNHSNPTDGWQLLDATAINDHGQIVGQGIHRINGVDYTHAYLLTPTVSVAPATPSQITADGVGGFQVDVSWSAAANATDYLVYRSATPAGSATYLGVTTLLHYSDRNLSPNTSYYYTVVADNDTGQSDKSVEVMGTTNAAIVPSAITDLQASAISTSQIDLAWTPDSNVSRYKIMRSSTAVGGYYSIAYTTSARFSDINLPKATKYYYYVIPFNGALQGPNSNTATAKTLIPIPVNGPKITLLAIDANDVRITPYASLDLNATSYRVYRSATSVGPYIEIGQMAHDGLSYLDQTTQANTTYYYAMAATNSAGDGPQGIRVPVTTPSLVTNLTISPINSSQLSLQWQSVPSATSFFIFRRTATETAYTQVGTTNSRIYQDGNLQPGTRYYYRVSTHSNNPMESAEASGVTNPLPIPGALSNLTATPITRSQINLTWTAASSASSYQIYRGTVHGGYHSYVTTCTTLHYSDLGLVANTTYYYIVIPVNTTGQGPKSSEVSATTTLLPTVPGNLKATAVSKTQINLTWTASEGTANYTIYRSIAPGTGRTIIGTTNGVTSFSDSKLQPATRYYYVVVAGNNSGWTKSPEVSTLTNGLPGAPTLTATIVSKSHITLSWTAASAATTYVIYRSTVSGTGRVIIGTTTGLSFSNTALVPSTRYYYVVVAGNNYGWTKSEEVSAVTPGQ